MSSDPLVWSVTSLVYQPFEPRVPAVTARATEVGADLSNLMVSAAAGVLRPASFVHVPLKTWPLVSVVCDWSAVQETGVLTESAPEVCTVTLLVYQPFAPGVPPVTERVAVGALASYLIVADADLLLPALSVQA